MVYFILGAVAGLAINWIAASKFEKIANMKGHQGYFWWCFLLGVIGWAMVIALPDRKIPFPDGTKSVIQPAKQAIPEPDDVLPEL